MTKLWTLIPAKSFATAKQRLHPVLAPDARASLSAFLLTRTINIVREAMGDMPVAVVSSDPAVAASARAAGVDWVQQSARSGLNEELRDAAEMLSAGAGCLVIHTDLPLLQAADISALLAVPGDVVLASDHTGTGTNAMLHRAKTSPIFAFGSDSFRRHAETYHARGLQTATIIRTGLARDLDEPNDLQFLEKVADPELKALLSSVHSRHSDDG